MGVGEDFSTFKDNYQISAELMGQYPYRYKRITRQLNTDFWNTNSAEYHKYNAYQTNGQSALLQAVKKSIQNTYRTSDQDPEK
jgi:hypothetical protein